VARLTLKGTWSVEKEASIIYNIVVDWYIVMIITDDFSIV